MGIVKNLFQRILLPRLALVAILSSLLVTVVPGSVVCAEPVPCIGWFEQFGSSDNDFAPGVSTTAGGIYVGQQTGLRGWGQSYVRKYNAGGDELWVDHLSDNEDVCIFESVTSISACSTGIYATGSGAAVPSGDGGHGFVRKYDSIGNNTWTKLIGMDAVQVPKAITADSGGIYVAGETPAIFEGSFVCKYDAGGRVVWTKRYISNPVYSPSSVSVYSPYVYVAGVVAGTGESFVWKCNSDNGDVIWTRLPGFAPPVVVNGVAADATGVYVAGVAHDPSETNGRQAFVRKYDLDGGQVWTREFGSSMDDGANAIFVNSDGIYVAGYTEGTLPGQANNGGADAFVRKYDASGKEVWTCQFGSSGNDAATGISVDATAIYVCGETDGAMPGCQNLGAKDVFLARMNTSNPPAQPVNVLPMDAAIGASLTPTLQSTAFYDPDSGDTHAASQWQITTVRADYSNPVFDSGADTSNLTQMIVPSGKLDYYTIYYWRVRYQDNNGAWSDWSAETSFTTSAVGPGWELQNPLPQAYSLLGVWGSSATDVFAVGVGGAIVHYDGTAWSSVASGTNDTLRSVWGSSSSNVFAVGDGGRIMHDDGGVWIPMPSGTREDLYGIWGSSSSSVFAVGDSGTVLHYDGTAWSGVSSGTANDLRGIWGSSASDVFAVGAAGTILHGNGTAWSPMTSGTTYGLSGIWGTSASNVFAVGFALDETAPPDVGIYNFAVLRFNGSVWAAMHSGSESFFNGIWGSSSTDLLVVGGDYTGETVTRGIIRQCSGSAWSVTTCGKATQLNGVWGSSSSNVFAVGEHGTIMHYDGAAWDLVSGGATQDLYGIWGTSATDVFAVGGGWDHFPFDGYSTILHYNGSTWSEMPTGTTKWLTSVWGSSSTDVFAVGGMWDEGPYTRLILHYNGTTWSEMSSGTSDLTWTEFRDVWGSSSTDVFVVGDGGVLHYDGTAWSQMPTGGDDGFTAVWGTSGSDVFAVGNVGSVMHYDGTSWSHMDTGVTTNGHLNGIWGSSSSDVFAVGSQWSSSPGSRVHDIILHYNGSVWSTVYSGPPGSLENVWGSSATDVFTVGRHWEGSSIGGRGAILHYDGNSWSSVTSGTADILSGIWGTSSSDVFAVGDGGTILHHGGPVAPAVSTEPVNNITTTSARLNGSLTSLGTATPVQVYFEWGLTTSYGNTTTPQTMNEPGGFSFTLENLTPGTTYHARAKAEGDLPANGQDVPFTTGTAGIPPIVATNDATDIGARYATLNGDLVSLGSAHSVTVSFVWRVGSGPYAYETTAQGMTERGVFHFDLGGLTPGTTYHYKAKAAGDGTAYGGEKTFTTGPAVPPVIVTGEPTNVTVSSARLKGGLTSLGTANSVIVSFVWGTSPGGPYPHETTDQRMTSPGIFHFDLGGLTPGTTYYYQAKGVGDGASYDGEKSFTTGRIPEIGDVRPGAGERNQSVMVTISGTDFEGATMVRFGERIRVEDFTVNSSTEITAQISIDADAALGSRDVSVTTGWGTGTKTGGFKVVSGGGGICSGGASIAPGAPSEMITVLGALGVLFGVTYWLMRNSRRRRTIRAEA